MQNWRITEWLHHFICGQVAPGDICIDATMGNGNDTVLLSKLAGAQGKVLAFDIQEEALKHTQRRLIQEGCDKNYELILDSHEHIGSYAESAAVSCITFNFGYLPGGDHRIATQAASSVCAIESGLRLLKKNGLMTLGIYSGGDSGFAERDAILQYVTNLDPGKFLVILSEYANRPNHPPIPGLIIKLEGK